MEEKPSCVPVYLIVAFNFFYKNYLFCSLHLIVYFYRFVINLGKMVFFLNKYFLLFFNEIMVRYMYFQNVPDPNLFVEKQEISGPSCSKLTTSLVNDSLKFTSSDTHIC